MREFIYGETIWTKRDIETSVRRLTKLSQHLRSLPAKKFNLDTWVNQPTVRFGEDIDESKVIDDVNNPECGTTACACGHAATIPEFRRAGLKFTQNYWGGNEIQYKKPGSKGDASIAFRAASEFFKLENDISDYLFSPDEYPHNAKGRMAVVNRIEAHVRKLQRELAK